MTHLITFRKIESSPLTLHKTEMAANIVLPKGQQNPKSGVESWLHLMECFVTC